jgi:hypothetical protein
MSTPALKPRPSARRITARTASSSPRARIVVASLNQPAAGRALTGGWFITHSATPSVPTDELIMAGPLARTGHGAGARQTAGSRVAAAAEPGQDGLCLMVDEILAPYLKDLREAYKLVLSRTADPRSKLGDLVVASLRVADAHPHATEIYQSERQLPVARLPCSRAREARKAWLDVIGDGVAQGAFREDVEAGSSTG